MNDFNELNFQEVDFADELIRAIEEDYGRSVMRIPLFEKIAPNAFEIKIIFTDYTLLEATITVIPDSFIEYSTIRISGMYF